MKSQDCDCQAEDIYDLGSHIFKVHSSENFEEIIKCRYCQQTFNGKCELMIHRKIHHTNRVSICSKFLDETCSFGSEDCWYKHEKPTRMFSCTHCEKEFTIKSKLVNHRKQEHKDKIKVCINSTNGLCKFKSDCWYKHEDIEDRNRNENKNQETFDNENIQQIHIYECRN